MKKDTALLFKSWRFSERE